MAVNSKAINKIIVDTDSQICVAGYAAQTGVNPEDYHKIPVATSIACFRGLQAAQWSWMMNHLGKGEKKNKDGEVTKPEERAQDWFKEGKLIFGMGADDGTNFRKSVAVTQEYKSKRGEKPIHYEQIREYVSKTWNAHLVTGMETDDWCGIELAKAPNTSLCLHQDKDINQCPGWHTWYEAKSLHNRKPYYVDEYGYMYLERSNSGSLEVHATGLHLLAYQVLKGDPVDTIPGVQKGFGPEKIFDYLSGVSPKLLLPKCYEKYVQVYGEDVGHDRYHEALQLVRILGDDKPKGVFSKNDMKSLTAKY
jgi:hypothetical protein